MSDPVVVGDEHEEARQALAQLIVRTREDRRGHGTGGVTQDDYAVADAVLAAGFRRPLPIQGDEK